MKNLKKIRLIYDNKFHKLLINYTSHKLSKFKYYRKIILYKYFSKYQEYKLFHTFKLNENSIFIDIGANVGKVSQFIDDFYSCNIIAYEPHPTAFKILSRKLDGKKKVKLYNKAVSNKNSEKKLFFHKDDIDNGKTLAHAGSSSLELKKNTVSEKKYIITKTSNIDDILNNYTFIDCIKIDIEGHEYQILPQLINKIDKIGRIVIEMHGNDLNHANFINDYNKYLKIFKERMLLNKKIFLWT